MENMAGIPQLYFGGDMEAAIPLSGEVCGRIDAVISARQIIDETMAGFHDVIRGLARQYAG
jgi:enoyl-[acyl-carrier protein] reductase II